jgi:hypothetical protein
MSYKSRSRNRAIRAAAATQRASPEPRWYLTLVTRATCCARCAGVLRPGREMVYLHTPRTALCKFCAEDDPSIRPRPSRRWERKRMGER